MGDNEFILFGGQPVDRRRGPAAKGYESSKANSSRSIQMSIVTRWVSYFIIVIGLTVAPGLIAIGLATSAHA
ncbi:hypothetical protein MAUB_37710 [Mycolicibacterium aubagnense]|uniref:Uncharacterized protein n=1 Tax=Mycolicibacterium aubagnense TaxID=319707 RepID=A0ABM7IGX3_9MYCO|nr:hypothetical protein C1S80_01700 [Mycolicibacterium aubagnense]BBX85898.1 hypothetical protein MAUB_37710 [Mycolicibacterium aubagnense]